MKASEFGDVVVPCGALGVFVGMGPLWRFGGIFYIELEKGTKEIRRGINKIGRNRLFFLGGFSYP